MCPYQACWLGCWLVCCSLKVPSCRKLAAHLIPHCSEPTVFLQTACPHAHSQDDHAPRLWVRDPGLASQSAAAGRGGQSHVPGAHHGLLNMHRVSGALQAPDRACGYLVKSLRLFHVGDNEDPST